MSSPLSTHSAPATNNVFGAMRPSTNEVGGATMQSFNIRKDPMLSEVSGKK